MIKPEVIDRIMSAVNIVDVINDRVTLKKSGKNYMACCPFHEERTPSFTVEESKQFFMCFGCGASGDAAKFLMDYERLSFVEAMKKLSQITGIPIEEDLNQSTPIISKRQMDKLNDAELTEKLVVAIYENGNGFTDDDKRRYSLAKARLKQINKMKHNL